MTNEDKEKIRFFKRMKKLLDSIVFHPKYESFSNYLSKIEYSFLYQVGKAKCYGDLPVYDVEYMLKKIKKRMMEF